MSFTFKSNTNARVSKDGHSRIIRGILYNQTGLQRIWKITKIRTNSNKSIPSAMNIHQTSTSSSIICIPNLFDMIITQNINQRDSAQSIYRHCQGITLGSALLKLRLRYVDFSLASTACTVHLNLNLGENNM